MSSSSAAPPAVQLGTAYHHGHSTHAADARDPAAVHGSLLQALFNPQRSFVQLLDSAERPAAVRALRQASRELRQLIDESSCTLSIVISQPMLDSRHNRIRRCIKGAGARVRAQARALGAAMGRYHTRLLHATRLELHAADINDPGDDGLAAFMAGYLATPGVAAGLGRVEACALQPAEMVPD